MRYHLTSTEMALIKRTDDTGADEAAEGLEPRHSAAGRYSGVATVKNSLAVSLTINNGLSI